MGRLRNLILLNGVAHKCESSSKVLYRDNTIEKMSFVCKIN